jgi:nucleotide-binding universal stress UspA family protein
VFQPKLILYPTDFSTPSAHACAVAADLARQYGGCLLVLHVVETLGPENVTHGEAVSQREPEGYRERLQADLRQVGPASGAGLAVVRLLAEGDPADEIVRAARAQGCDLIVMGTHGRTGLSRLLIGSVAEQVVRTAPCSVLTVKTPGAGKADGAEETAPVRLAARPPR